MEASVARFAVYNLADLLDYIKSFLLSIPSGYIVLNSSHRGVWILILTIGCFSAIIFYLFKSTWATYVDEANNLSVSDAQKNDEIIRAFQKYLKKWVQDNRPSHKDLCYLWLNSLNGCLSKSENTVPLLLRSMLLEPQFSVDRARYEFRKSGEMDETHVKFRVKFPLSSLECEVQNFDSPTVEFVLSVQDFVAEFAVIVRHVGAALVELGMTVEGEPQMVLSARDPVVEVRLLERQLLDAFSKCEVHWTPSMMVPRAIPRKHPAPQAANSPNTAPHEKSDNVAVKESPQNVPTIAVASSSAAERPDSGDTTSKSPLQNVPPGRGSLSNLDNQSLQAKLVTNPIRRLSQTTNIPSENFPVLSNGPSSSSVKMDSSASPVILSYNARVKQSIAARQTPRRAQTQLVRSASCYAEETPFCSPATQEQTDTENYEDIPLTANTIFVPPLNGSTDKLTNSEKKPEKNFLEPVVLHASEFDTSDRLSNQQFSQADANLLTSDPQSFPQNKAQHYLRDISPAEERAAHSLACKKLLVKVVKAEELNLKSTSNTYCVVELDEPYQRHTTHCSSAGQMFWDQHLLFDLNTNSKRVALEVFELSKRKKSVSKGRTELLLSDLLNAGPVPEPEGDVWGTSEHRRRLTLSSTGSTLSTSTTGAPSSPNPSLSSGGLSGGAHSPCPTVTAEFHFMEKSMEDPLMSRQRAAVSNAFGVHRVLPSHDWLQSASAQDSPILGPAAVTTGPISHSTSLDFPQTKYVPVRRAEVVVEGEVVGDLGPPASASPVIRSEEKIATATITTAGEADQPVEGPRNLRAGELSPPIQSLRAQIEVLPTSNTSAFSASISRSPQAQADSGTDTQTLVGQTKVVDGLVEQLPKTENLVDLSSCVRQPPVEAGNGGSSSSDRLSRTDSLIKRSQLIGADETSVHSRQALLPYPDSDFDITKDGSDPTVAASGSVLRSHSLANRLKSSRLLPSGMRSGKRSSEDSTMGGSASLALLGPSRQLAGVVASLSTLPTDPGTSPISAAALASAVAVAGATGSWQQPPGVENYDRFGRGTPSTSSVKSKSAENDADTLIPSPAQAAPPEPPVRYMPPAASVAADSPGTYTAQTQHPRRSDGSNLSLFRLFRHKKKRFRSAGPEKLLYLDNSDLEDFDAISTEGYYRIVQDPDPRPQMQHPNR